MKKQQLTRRMFLGIAASVGLTTTLTACKTPPAANGVIAYKRSGRGCRISNAAKKHNANRLYATRSAALQNPAHAGDNSKVVQVTISRARYDTLFPTGKLIADLRRDR